MHFANVIGCNNMLMPKVCKSFCKLLQFIGAFILLYMCERHKADIQSMLMCQILSQSVYSVALWWLKTPNFAIFGLQLIVVSPICGVWRKVNMGAQLQTFPYPTV